MSGGTTYSQNHVTYSDDEELINLLQINISDPGHESFAKFDMVGGHFQSPEVFFDKDEFISHIVTENTNPANDPEDEQKKNVLTVLT